MNKKEIEDQQVFIEGLIARGEAVEADANGKIPHNATHVLTIDAQGNKTVKRIRFAGMVSQ